MDYKAKTATRSNSVTLADATGTTNCTSAAAARSPRVRDERITKPMHTPTN